jgi:hypothetical protein
MSKKGIPTIQSSQTFDFNKYLKEEGQPFSYNSCLNNLGSYALIANPIAGVSTNLGWRGATLPTITANTYVYCGAIHRQYSGRQGFIQKIKIEVTQDCEILLVHYPDAVNTLGTTGRFSYDQLTAYHRASVTTSTGGSVVFDFTNSLKNVKSGERIDMYYYRNGTTGTNWQVNIEGYDVSSDSDYYADTKFAVIGDSISGITSVLGDLEYSERGSAITGLWCKIIKNNLLKAGIWAREVNLGQGGTSSDQWDWWVNQGKMNQLKDINLLFVNLGMNDIRTDTNLSTTTGVDGIFKKSMKNIISTYFKLNPKGSCIVNQVTQSDDTTRNTNVASGIYAGIPRITAIRTELSNTITELQTANPTWDLQLSATDTAYLKTDATAFLSTESTNGRIHPNVTVGQPAMATLIWTKVLLTNFYLKKGLIY